MKSKKIFLGGTCNQSMWRSELIPMLEIDFFNPVVDVWTTSDYEEELRQRESCDFCLYVITSEIEGFYSIAEVIDDSNKRPYKTLFCFIKKGFSEHQLNSLRAIGQMVEENGGKWFENLAKVIEFVNQDK